MRKNNRHNELTLMVAAGGTGGHVYPAIAIAQAVHEMRPDARITFIGTRNHMEWTEVPKAGFKIENIWISGFHRHFTLKNLLFPVKLVVSILQSIKLIRRYRPDVMLCCGGYVAGPAGWAARLLGIPLVLQEQNSYPGVTNRLLGRWATQVFTAFNEANRFFPDEIARNVGNPTRQNLNNASRENAHRHFRFDSSIPVLLVMGGSGGAKRINEAMLDNLNTLHNKMALQIIWQCGHKYIDKIADEINIKQYKRLRLKAFLDDIELAYKAADLVVSRAGAGTCAELQITGSASILVPSPNVAGNHQHKNAQAMANEGAAIIAEDHELKNTLAELVDSYIKDQSSLKAMQKAAARMAKPDSANIIAENILELSNTYETA